MKKRIKLLKGKTIRLKWGKNGNPHDAVGIIEKLWKVRFDFFMNGEELLRIRYENVTDVELIKQK